MMQALRFGELLYHSVVHDIRKSSGNATLGILILIAQKLALLAVFYVLFSVLGMKGLVIRGDFVLFLLSGIFLFVMHNRAIMATMGAPTAVSPMLQHGPVTTFLLIASQSIAQLYMTVMATLIILFGLHTIQGGLEIMDPIGFAFAFLLAWASGIAIGLLFMVAKPFAPTVVPTLAMIYRRANMITSGKMFPVNLMNAWMITWFAWNPLFHIIDQARGAVFVNYFPRHTSWEYPIYFIPVAVMIALLVEFWLRRNLSTSWFKRSL